MPKFDTAATFANYDVAALEAIAAEIHMLIEAKQRAELEAARAKAESVLAKLGYKLEDLLPQKARKVSTVKPKYRDPKTNVAWSGRGVAPAWMPKDKAKWDALLIPEAEANAVNGALQ